MSTTFDKKEYTNGLIKQAFMAHPVSDSKKLITYYEWLDEFLSLSRIQNDLFETLLHYDIVKTDHNFSDYAVENGLAVLIYTKWEFGGDALIFEKEWHITKQGEEFIKQIFQDNIWRQ